LHPFLHPFCILFASFFDFILRDFEDCKESFLYVKCYNNFCNIAK
jgi:hypothetical protein